MTTYSRYHVTLVEELADLPAPWVPPLVHGVPDDAPRSLGLRALVEAFRGLDRRSEGPEAWAPSFSTNALAFLLDVMSDPVFVRRVDGTVVFQNRAAAGLEVPPRARGPIDEVRAGEVRYERRAIGFREAGQTTIVEILRQL